MGQSESSKCGSKECRPCAGGQQIDAAEESLRREEEERRYEAERQESQRRQLESQHAEAERNRQVEAARVEAEAQKKEQEEEERRRAEEAAAQAERAEAERRAQVVRDEEARRLEAERLEKERKAKEERDKQAVEAFLSANGFTDVNFKRSRRMKKSYPLHEAVQQSNSELAQQLLAARADPALKNSSNKTPLELAHKRDAGNSHAAVIQVLADASGVHFSM